MKTPLILITILAVLPSYGQLTTEPAPKINAVGAGHNLDWYGQLGRGYFIECSDDMSNWHYLPVIEHGTDAAIGYGITPPAQSIFLRVRYTEEALADPWAEDSDGDGISNWNEVRAGGTGTDPFLLDSNNNGISDGAEDRDNDGTSDADELQAGTDPDDASSGGRDDPEVDTDNDGINNAFDAVHADKEINWEKTPESSYVWVEIAELDPVSVNGGNRVLDGTQGYPVAVNKHTQVLFSADLWYGGTSDWVGLQTSGSLPVTVTPYGIPPSQSLNLTQELRECLDINDNGDILGMSGEHPDYLVYSAGMTWQRVGSSYSQYNTPDYFLKTTDIQYQEDGVFQLGGLANDGTIYCANNSFNTFSIGDTSSVFTVFKEAQNNDAYIPSKPLDSNRGITWKHNSGSLQLLLREDTELTAVGMPIQGSGSEFIPSTINVIPQTKNLDGTDQSERLWISAGSKIYLEKSEGTPAARWHHPPSMHKALKRLNSRGEALSNDELWRNGKYQSLTQILEAATETTGIENLKAIDLASNGIILIQAKIAGKLKAGILLPVEFDLFPPEPTEDEIAAAGDDYWEVKTFQISADSPKFLVQATVLVPGEDDDGKFKMVTAEDGTEITWEIDEDSSAGGSLSSTTSVTENGLATVTLTTSTTPRDLFKVKAKITKLIYKAPGSDTSVTHANSEGLLKLKTKNFEVVPGVVDSITLQKQKNGAAVTSMTADGKSEIELIATLTDENGNPAAAGTPVDWHVKGSGYIKNPEYHIKDETGIVRATLVAGTLADSQLVNVIADDVFIEEGVQNSSVVSTGMVANPNSLDVAQTQTSAITLTLQDVADGSEIHWLASKGELIYTDAKVNNGQAKATLCVSEGTIGSSKVVATVGDKVFSCEVTLTSSKPVSIAVDHPLIVSDDTVDGTEVIETIDGVNEPQLYFASTPVRLKAPIQHAGEWVTVGVSGNNTSVAHLFSFDSQTGNTSADSVAQLPATLANGAVTQLSPNPVIKGLGALDLPDIGATASIPHAASLSLVDGSSLDLWIYPRELSGTLIEKSGEYSVSLNSEGYLTFTYGSGAELKTVTSAIPILLNKWSNVRMVKSSGRVELLVNSSINYVEYTGNVSTGSSPLVVGGVNAVVDDLRITHASTQIAGITIQTQGLDAQDRIQLDSNGEAVFTVSAPATQAGGGDAPLSQGLDVSVQLAGEETKAKDAIRVSKKGAARVLYAIAGEVSAVGLNNTDLDREEFAANFLRKAAKFADRVGALPKDLAGGAVDRAKTGYFIAIWMEEQVDDAGEARQLMKISAAGLPAPIAKILNLMLAEQLLGAASRSDSEYFTEYMSRQREFTEALRVLSTGDIDSFVRLSKLVDGDMAYAKAGVVADEIGHGPVVSLGTSVGDTLGDGMDVIGRWVNGQGWRLKMQTTKEAGAELDGYRKTGIANLAGIALGSEDFLKGASTACLTQGLIDERGAAAFGFIYGIAEKSVEVGQEALQPDAAAAAVAQMIDLCILASGGDEDAKKAIGNIVSSVSQATADLIPEVSTQWQQGNYFEAGKESVDVAEVGLIVKAASGLLLKVANRGIIHGRKLDADIDWTDSRIRKIGARAENLAHQRLHAQGYKNIVPIRNNSDHGIDLVCQDKSGGIVFIEVKGHGAAAPLRLSRDQTNMEDFVRDRLNKADAGEGHWAHVQPEVQENARALLEAMDADLPFRGIVIDVQYTMAPNPSLRYYEWVEGVGGVIPQ